MQVLVSLLKAIREGEGGDKVVLVSNYTESLALCGKVGRAACAVHAARAARAVHAVTAGCCGVWVVVQWVCW